MAPGGGGVRRGGSGSKESENMDIFARFWTFLIPQTELSYCTDQMGFGKKATEIAKWAEKFKHNEKFKTAH